MNPELSIEKYDYSLPDNLIAQKPLPQRDQSKLLVYRHGKTEHQTFGDLCSFLPSNADMFFNNAKVIPARMHFKRATGADIEIFILHPAGDKDIQIVLESSNGSAWTCLVRNLKKWKDDEKISSHFTIGSQRVPIHAFLKNREEMEVAFNWDSDHSFSEVLQALGKVPLPPYIKRASDETDKKSYQTVYADKEGAVAAPTAGLHFTAELELQLKAAGVRSHYLTLHVGAGTFKPVSTNRIDLHDMHSEQFEIEIGMLRALLESKFRIAVGTTSLRTLESTYWIGVKLLNGTENPFHIEQHIAKVNFSAKPSFEQSLEALLNYLEKQGLDRVTASTAIMIYPGYTIKSIDALITNFHLPKSTLIMLVAAFIGESWRDIYEEAIAENYRFLSYGDSSLLIPSKEVMQK
jgi:S-adenosylmethionine:tRNA ribosyltransferase-isomerase